jgi:hypothetical protein
MGGGRRKVKYGLSQLRRVDGRDCIFDHLWRVRERVLEVSVSKLASRNESMDTWGVSVARAEHIKWWDACDALSLWADEARPPEGLSLARECTHPDAQWLVSRLPVSGDVTHQLMSEVMLG